MNRIALGLILLGLVVAITTDSLALAACGALVLGIGAVRLIWDSLSEE